MRAVLDTNVIISGALSRGSMPDHILRAQRRQAFELVTSDELLAELSSVLSRRKISDRLGWSAADIQEFVTDIRENAVISAPGRRLNVVIADESDNRVLEAALESNADYIVTGDRHLVGLGEYEGIAIVTPARFVALLETMSG